MLSFTKLPPNHFGMCFRWDVYHCPLYCELWRSELSRSEQWQQAMDDQWQQWRREWRRKLSRSAHTQQPMADQLLQISVQWWQ